MKNKILAITLTTIFIISISLLTCTYATNETENTTTNETTTTTNEVNTNTNSSQNQTQTETTTQNNNTTSNNSQNKASSNSNSQRQTTNEKSSNANLSNLGIRPNDFSGFTPNKTSYDVKVPENIETVEVYAQAQNSNATIEGTGNVTLKEGNNTINVKVTAEDGTVKTYTLNITRGEIQNEQNNETTNTGSGLLKLEVSNAKIEPEFKTDVYEYTVKYIGEGTSLEITTEATQEGYTVEILGNQDLKEGENLISIVVLDTEGNNIATYQLIVNKSLVDEEAIAREKAEKEARTKTIIISVAVAVLIIIIVIAIIIRKRRNRMYAEDYLEPYSGIDDDNYYNTNNIDYNSNYDYDNDGYNNNYNDTNENTDNIQEHINEGLLEEENDKELLKEENSQEDDEQKLKEKIKKEFLDNYNLSDENTELEEVPRKRHKGKRFK